MTDFRTLRYRAADGVGWVTLDRPDRHNAFDRTLVDELHGLWRSLRFDDAVRVIVLTGAGDRAFCTGIDRAEVIPQPSSPFMADDPSERLGPKSAGLWKPVIAAVNGMACGGAFHLLGESEFVIAAEHATFFDPHVSYGMVAAVEPAQLSRRLPFGELMRMSLTGTAERITARRAYEIGLVSEVVPGAELHAAADRVATVIASHPPAAVQGTVRAVWAARDMSRQQALAVAPSLVNLGSLDKDGQEDLFRTRPGTWRPR
ncbi:enoyl-CoA hydratase/isomerase family protein [Spirillospora sp. CA-142024]|uniref:enoyl-CoA hydratase/isomerase family protein n=1 Tax=Spirillospora sp. CA-142024 TaxID=3240036 RepID=UPI003D937EC4